MSGKEYTKPNSRSSGKNPNRHFLNKKKILTATTESLFMGAIKVIFVAYIITVPVFYYNLLLEYLPDRSYISPTTRRPTPTSTPALLFQKT
jgi:hypothetical protein